MCIMQSTQCLIRWPSRLFTWVESRHLMIRIHSCDTAESNEWIDSFIHSTSARLQIMNLGIHHRPHRTTRRGTPILRKHSHYNVYWLFLVHSVLSAKSEKNMFIMLADPLCKHPHVSRWGGCLSHDESQLSLRVAIISLRMSRKWMNIFLVQHGVI